MIGERDALALLLPRAGECAVLVAEQLALGQIAGNRRAINGDERRLGALRHAVHRFGNQAFPGARFTLQQDGNVGRAEPLDEPRHPLHGGAPADDHRACRLGRGARDRLLDFAPHHLGIDWFLEIVGRTHLDRLNGGLHLRIRRHHDDRHIGGAFLERAEHRDAAHLRQHHVEQHNVGTKPFEFGQAFFAA